jgi:dihydrofolate reductase/thymidylate synthase
MEKTNKLYYNLILAICKNKGIGMGGKLPWKLSRDMLHFKTITTRTLNEYEDLTNLVASNMLGNTKEIIKTLPKKSPSSKKNIVVMGRSTWDSIPLKFRPLSGRINVVLSRNDEFHKKNPQIEETFYVSHNIESFFKLASELEARNLLNEIFVIGGSQVYNDFVKNYPSQCKLIYQTYIEKEYESDVFYELPKDYLPVSVSKTFVDESEPETPFDFRVLLNPEVLKEDNLVKQFHKIVDPKVFGDHPKNEELQYLDAIRDIIENGSSKDDRTGVGTISKFGVTMRFDCSKTFPLLTTKDTFWRGIVEELLWFIKGDTNAKNLQKKKVHIWDGNASREYLDSIGLNEREEGDLGPVYGFQWRHFGAEYKTMHDDYTGQGIDQLAGLIEDIKKNPTSRRLVMSAWNAKDLKLMALPPCHVLCQFYVTGGKLHLQMYQRSADMGLGVPFNIASYALLLRMVAQVCEIEPGDFVHVIGDAHVYKNHIEALQKQLKRTPRPLPVLRVNKEVKNIEDFKFDDFTIVNYNPFPKIKMDMAV